MKKETIDKINASGKKFFLAVAGGGQSFIGEFTKISGASKTLIGALVPYNQRIFDDFIGGTPDKYVSSEAARKLAVASYLRCVQVGVDPKVAIGIGSSSSIVKDNEREGREHKSFVATHSYGETSVASLVMKQGRTRLQEEQIIADLILCQLSRNTIKQAVRFLSDDDLQDVKVDFEFNDNPTFIKLANGEIDTNSSVDICNLKSINLYGGSFNPLHEGHLRIKNCAETLLGSKVILELTLRNADKGMLDYIEVANRVKGLGKHDYLLTAVPTIREKIDVICKYNKTAPITFIVGADTWNRIWNEKYGYAIEDLMTYFRAARVKFLVFSRPNVEPITIAGDLHEVIKLEGNDISSTAIRKERIAHES